MTDELSKSMPLETYAYMVALRTLRDVGVIVSKLIIILTIISVLASFLNPDALKDRRIAHVTYLLIAAEVIILSALFFDRNYRVWRILGWRKFRQYRLFWLREKVLLLRLNVLQTGFHATYRFADIWPQSMLYLMLLEQAIRISLKWYDLFLATLVLQQEIDDFMNEFSRPEEVPEIPPNNIAEMREHAERSIAIGHKILAEIQSIKSAWKNLPPQEIRQTINRILNALHSMNISQSQHPL